MDDDDAPTTTAPRVIYRLGNQHRELARIDSSGRLFMRDEATAAMVESYDMSRFGRLVYKAVTGGKEPPT